MSSSSQNNSARVTELQQSITFMQVAVATTACYSYEWLTTFDQEVNHIWARKWTLSTFIFLCSRYATLLMIIIQLLPALTRISCVAEIVLSDALTLLILLTSALFTGIRTAALCNRNIWMFLLVFSLSGVLAFADLVLFIQAPIQFTSDPLTCAALSPDTRAQEIRISLALRITNIAADAIALIIAWRKAIGSVREASRRCIRVPLSEVLIRDGTVLFIGFLAINVVQLLWDNIWHDGRPNYMVPLANMLPSILMCRFMLNLRQAANQSDLGSTMQTSTVRFNTKISIGTLLESVYFGEDDTAADDSESEIQNRPQHMPVVEGRKPQSAVHINSTDFRVQGTQSSFSSGDMTHIIEESHIIA